MFLCFGVAILITVEVGKRPMDVAMAELIKENACNELLEGYPLQAALGSAISAKSALVAYRRGLNAFTTKTFRWCDEAPSWEAVSTGLQCAIDDVLGYKGCIDRAKKGCKRDLDAYKRSTRTSKDNMRDIFTGSKDKVPDAVAKVASDLLIARLTEQDEVITICNYKPVEFYQGHLYDDDALSRPMLVSPKDKVSEPTHFHEECHRVFEECSDLAAEKDKECCDDMRERNVSGNKACITPPGQAFDFNGTIVSGKDLFQCSDGLKLFLRSQRCAGVHISGEAYPARMHAGMLHIFKGTCVVIMLPPELLLRWPNIEAYIYR